MASKGFQLGDWLDPSAPPDDPAAGRTDGNLVATGLLRPRPRDSWPTPPTSSAADDAAHYRRARAPARRSVPPGVRHAQRTAGQDSPTAYALALQFDLLADAEQRRAGRPAAGRARPADRHRIATGFLGTPLVSTPSSTPGTSTTPTSCCCRRVPVVALPGDDGGDHGLGALGQHAARRHDQPRRDDLVQPLRPRRRRRLPPPHGWPAWPSAPPAAATTTSSPARWRPHRRRGDPRDPLRPRCGRLAPPGTTAPAERGPPPEGDGHRGPPRRVDDRFAPATTSSRAHAVPPTRTRRRRDPPPRS